MTSSANNSGTRGDPQQIPTEDVSDETEKVVSEQGGVPGQRKEVNVESYSKVASLGQILKDLKFPADKAEIIQFIKQQKSTDEILLKLETIPNRQYQNVSDVTNAAGLVY
jgi:hypothetical protein